jgi:pSer/pThr/pTyr-binding forkhead associated (FHA) protein
LTLLHPTQGITIQRWTFGHEPRVRIGRAPDNDVVIRADVVSRYHAELVRQGADWELIGLGSNGTFVDGQRVAKTLLKDGQTVVLATGGPTLRVQTSLERVESFETTITTNVLFDLKIEIDESERQRRVTEITDSGYFQQLLQRANQLRKTKSA